MYVFGDDGYHESASDAETMTIVAEEFGYEVDFVNADIEDSIAEVEDLGRRFTNTCANHHGDGSRRSW
jgi:bacterial translation initiation factor 2 (bIF-2)